MIEYTVYSPITSKVLKTGKCQEGDLQLQKAEDEEVVEGTYEDDMYYWDNGFKLIPPRPGDDYIFDYNNHQWVLDAEQLDRNARALRDAKLQESDWTQLPDVVLTNKEEWATYRQSLRDITSQPDYPINIVWPVPPQ